MKNKKAITGYKDLEVYQITYAAAIQVAKEIIPKLPAYEKYDLVDQLRRSSKAIPRLIAEGYAKKHQNRGFQKYLDDALGECNETGVSLEQCGDIYNIESQELVALYDRAGKQIYRLSQAWTY
ncbi:four helix bundle protein, partial [Candidatus Margulisiibacteriota bacterium]